MAVRENLDVQLKVADPLETSEALDRKLDHLFISKREQIKKVLYEGDVIAGYLFDPWPSNFLIEGSFEVSCRKPISYRVAADLQSKTNWYERN